ncbi:MAG: efflux RND transporter permease subunit [Balneolaceae bacterium]
MKIIDLSTRRRVTIAMFTIGILLFGMVSLSRLKVNLLPELSYPSLTVRTEYPGAAPAEIENLVSKPVEEALGVIKNVQQVRSVSRTSQSDVMIEFNWGANMDYAILDVREKLDALQLPLEASRPVILRFDPSLEPIMRYALHIRTGEQDRRNLADGGNADGEVLPVSAQDAETSDEINNRPQKGISASFNIDELKSLRIFGDEILKKELESAPGVASVKISGGLEEEIQILADQQRMSHLGIPIERITSILNAENVNLSGGRLEEGSQQYLVRTLNQFESVEQIQDVVITHQNGSPVYLRDLAEIRRSYKEREAVTRLNGMEAVEIAIYKEGDANTVAAANAVKARMDRVQELLPPEMAFVKVYDQSEFIESAVNEVVNAGIIGGILAVIILYLFLRNFWTTIIISVSIPVSVIATFNLMYGNDITLNIMSLGGIALGIGLLVDNSIVVLENIARHREKGKSITEAAREGAGEVGMAVVASTLTTVAVFFPLIFVEGIAGQLFRDQALTVTFALLASLLVAITLIPMMASLGDRRTTEPSEDIKIPEPKTRLGRGLRRMRLFVFTTLPTFLLRNLLKVFRGISRGILVLLNPLLNLFEKSYQSISDIYAGLLNRALRHKLWVILMALLMLAGSAALIPHIGIELIPSLSQGEFRVDFNYPPGTPLEKTDQSIRRVQQASLLLDGVASTYGVAGTGTRMDANPDEGGENRGELSVMLPDGSGRNQEEQVMQQMRLELEQIPGLQYNFSRPALFTFKTPVEIEIFGFDLERLKEAGDQIAARLSASPRFADVNSTLEQGSPEVRIEFDRDKAASLGLQVHDVAQRVVSNLRGDVATRFSWRDRKIDVLVRVQESDRESVHQIGELIVNPDSDRPVSLDAIATVHIGTGPAEIRRVAQQRVALVSANLNFGSLDEAAREISGILDNAVLPYGIHAQIGGQNEEMNASFRSLLFALLLAIFLVYLVMASQFESLLHPFIILFTIPLAGVGAILALYVTGSTISVVVFIGLILLAGIVVNNAIVLIDLINQLRAEGMEKMAAIAEGARSRLRPILMTTLTTTLGLLPLAIGFGDGSELRAPMAITVIGGLLVSTLLTLVVIPVVYALLDRKAYPTPDLE